MTPIIEAAAPHADLLAHAGIALALLLTLAAAVGALVRTLRGLSDGRECDDTPMRIPVELPPPVKSDGPIVFYDEPPTLNAHDRPRRTIKSARVIVEGTTPIKQGKWELPK